MTSPEPRIRRARAAPSLPAGAALLAALLAGAAGAVPEPVNRIVLRVNGEIATLAEYQERRSLRIEQIAAAEELDVARRRELVAEAGRITMKELFDELLVLSRARQLRIEVTPAQLDRAADNAKKRFGIESDEEFTVALAQQGLTPDSFRERMARTMLFNQVVEQEVQSKIAIEDDEVARYWQSHAAEFVRPERRRVEEVVVHEDSPLDSEARSALARDIAARATAGESLAEAAAAAAEAAAAPPTAVSSVIDHGWIERGTLATALDEAAFGLASVGVAAPVAARGGLHLVRVVEVEPEAQRPLAEVEEEIRRRLGQDRFEQRTREFLAEQAAKAYVVESLPEDAVGYRSAETGAVDPVRDLLHGESGAPSAEPSEPAEPSAASGASRSTRTTPAT